MSNHTLTHGRSGRLVLAFLVAAALAVMVGPPVGAANPGALDPTFGTGGKVTTDFGVGSGASALAIQDDGRLVAVGKADGFGLARYNVDGSLDASFGGGGTVSGDFDEFMTAGSAQAVALQTDGKIVAVGGFQNSFALARYNSDGSLDTTFGSDGLVTSDFGVVGFSATAHAVAVQADGKIVVAGGAGGDVGLARYNTDGSLDTTFDTDGMVRSDVGSWNSDMAYSVVIQPDGRIVAAGTTDDVTSSNGDVAVLRYGSDGSLDTTFGTGGVVVTDIGVGGSARALALQLDGKIVAAGFATNAYNDDFLVVRYNPDGTLDESFDNDGVAVTDIASSDIAADVAVQTDGRIVVVGPTQVTSLPRSYDFALMRYNADGSLDTSFDGDGIVTTGGSFERATAVAIQGNGRIVAAGHTNEPHFALARYMPGNEAPVAVDDGPYTVLSGGTVGGNVLTNDTDADGDSLTALKVSNVAHGELTLSADGTVSYTADIGFHGSDTFTYQAHDGTDVSNVATVAIAVSPVASNVGLVDPSRGLWHLRSHESAEATTILSFYFGNPGDVPFTGDWDCDGNETPGLFRTSDAFAYLRNSNSQGIADTRFFFGNPSDVPLAGDFNGDGCDTLSIYRPSEARFYIMNKLGENEGGLGAADYSFLFGNQGDKPVVGDWDGDGIDEIGLHRESTGFFYYRNTLMTGIADGQFFFGDPGDRFVAGDWGVVDGTDTPAMFRPSNDTFYFRHTLTQGNADSQFVWTDAGNSWMPVAGEFTAD